MALDAKRAIDKYNFCRFADMQDEHPTLWRGPRWTLAILLAILGMLGPFSIDTYIPAFSGIARALSWAAA